MRYTFLEMSRGPAGLPSRSSASLPLGRLPGDPLQRAMREHSHRSRPLAYDPGNLRYGEATKHPQDDDFCLVMRKPRGQLSHGLLSSHIGHQLIGGISRAGAASPARVPVQHFGLHEYDPATRHPPPVINHPMPGDREKPRLEVPLVALEPLEALSNSQPHVTLEIFCNVRLLPPQVPDEQGMVCLVKRSNRFIVTALCRFQHGGKLAGTVVSDHR